MQETMVVLIVAYAAITVLLRYAPRAVVRQLRRMLAIAMKGIGLQGVAAMLAKDKVQAACGDGCSNCSGCEPGSPRQPGRTIMLKRAGAPEVSPTRSDARIS